MRSYWVLAVGNINDLPMLEFQHTVRCDPTVPTPSSDCPSSSTTAPWGCRCLVPVAAAYNFHQTLSAFPLAMDDLHPVSLESRHCTLCNSAIALRRRHCLSHSGHAPAFSTNILSSHTGYIRSANPRARKLNLLSCDAASETKVTAWVNFVFCRRIIFAGTVGPLIRWGGKWILISCSRTEGPYPRDDSMSSSVMGQLKRHNPSL